MIIIDLILTLFGYLIFPICYRNVNGTVPLKKAKKLALINSIVVSVIFELIQISLAIVLNDLTYIPSFAPALLYYWIAKAILKEKSSIVTTLEPEKKPETTLPRNTDSITSDFLSSDLYDRFKHSLEQAFTLSSFWVSGFDTYVPSAEKTARLPFDKLEKYRMSASPSEYAYMQYMLLSKYLRLKEHFRTIKEQNPKNYDWNFISEYQAEVEKRLRNMLNTDLSYNLFSIKVKNHKSANDLDTELYNSCRELYSKYKEYIDTISGTTDNIANSTENSGEIVFNTVSDIDKLVSESRGIEIMAPIPTAPKTRTVRAGTHAEFLNKIFGTKFTQRRTCTYKYNNYLDVWMVKFSGRTGEWENRLLKNGEIIHEKYTGSYKVERVRSTMRLAVSVEGDGANRIYVIKGVYRFCPEEGDERTLVYRKVPDEQASQWIPEAYEKYTIILQKPSKKPLIDDTPSVGDRIVHKRYGRNVGRLGTVISKDEIKIKVLFDNGTETSFVLPDCLKHFIVIEED